MHYYSKCDQNGRTTREIKAFEETDPKQHSLKLV